VAVDVIRAMALFGRCCCHFGHDIGYRFSKHMLFTYMYFQDNSATK